MQRLRTWAVLLPLRCSVPLVVIIFVLSDVRVVRSLGCRGCLIEGRESRHVHRHVRCGAHLGDQYVRLTEAEDIALA